MKIGYARVSTNEQNLALQTDALKKAGCEKLFHDQISGTKTTRPGLDEAFSYLRPGDVLVVWRLDRHGRSLKHLIETVNLLEEKGIGFQSLQESIDTTTSGHNQWPQSVGANSSSISLLPWLNLSAT
jgi:DNA invertase Pin-like site-specific DNA recombinase